LPKGADQGELDITIITRYRLNVAAMSCGDRRVHFLSFQYLFQYWLPPPRRLCFRSCLSVCPCVHLCEKYIKSLNADFDEISAGIGRGIMTNQLDFGSRSGSGVPGCGSRDPDPGTFQWILYLLLRFYRQPGIKHENPRRRYTLYRVLSK